jgi:hypothetical protein
MDYRSLTTVALRFTGIAVLINTISRAPATYLTIFRGGQMSAREAMLVLLFTEMLPLVIGLALIYFPARVGAAVFVSGPVPEQLEPNPDGPARRLGEIAAIVTGLYFFAAGCFDLIFSASKLWLDHAAIVRDNLSDVSWLPSRDVAALITAGFEILAGAILAVKAGTFFGWLLKARETGPKRES